MALFELKQDYGNEVEGLPPPPTFKDCAAADIDTVFFNGNEHADRHIIDGKDVPQDPVEALRLHQAVWTCGVRTALAHGGVVNDHHGVGIKLGRLMKEQYGPAMQVFEGLKKTLDPNGIMNPFKLGL